MAENERRILEMLREQKITVEEAERLLSLVSSEGNKGNTRTDEREEKRSLPRYLRVVVNPEASEANGERVNIRVPLSLIRAGMKFTALIPPLVADNVREAMKERGVDFDLRNFKPEDVEELIEALSDLEVNVEGGREKVRIYVE